MKKELDFWDYLILIGALIILVWALLKALNIIHTPIWVEMLPYFGGGISIIGGSYKLGEIMKGIDDTNKKVSLLMDLEKKFDKLENEHNLALNGKLKIH